MTDSDQDEDEYYVPLVDQRVFGAGLKRKRVAFVPATSYESTVPSMNESSNAGSRYLSIVMQKTSIPDTDQTIQENIDHTEQTKYSHTCPVCGQLLLVTDVSETHDTSIAHQICIQHSHPPSHLDRSRRGLKYLQGYGWDPDSRQGLGAHQEGIRIPIKAKEKKDSAGLGLLTIDEDKEPAKNKKKKNSQNIKVEKLNAKDIRKMEEEKTRRAEKLRQSVYGEDLSQYLGTNG